MKERQFWKFFLLLMLGLTSAIAQEKMVSGTVTDETGVPLPGVNVLVKGTNRGTQTDFDGNYTLKANTGEILLFTYLGLKDAARTIGASGNINVQMAENAEVLEGVIITALGVKRQPRSIGYAASLVDDKELTRVSNTNPFESLSGKLAGVDITIPAQPGASSKIIVRNFGSLSGNRPLYIVDGTVIGGDQVGSFGVDRTFDGGDGLGAIDPNSIESINVLKGGAATALYGERAASGAIIITTKKGKQNNRVTVEYVSSYDISEVGRIPHNQYEFGEGWNGLSYSSLPSGGFGASNENGSWGARFNGEVRPWGQIYNNSQQIKPYIGLEDNVRDFYDYGTTYTNSIRISGANDLSDASIGFTNVNSDGIIPTNSDAFRRSTVNINGGLNGKIISFRISANYAHKDQNAVNTGQGDDAGQGATMQQELLQVPSDISILDLKDYKNNVFNSPSYFYTPYAQNPYFLLNENSTKIVGERFFGNATISAKISNQLTANATIGGDIRNEYIKSYGAIVRYLDGSSQNLLGANEVVGGVTENLIDIKLLDAYLSLQYNTKLSDQLTLNALVGYNYSEQLGESLGVGVTNLDVPNFYELSNSAVTPTVTQANYKQIVNGFYSQAELGYLNRYFLTLTARNDFSSTLPIDNNSYFYPSAALSAIILDTQDGFVKLRTSLARIGKAAPRYRTSSNLIQGVSAASFGTILFPIGGINAYELSGTLGNSEITPELTDEFEVGFETRFFNSRLNLDAAYYMRKTDGLIIARTVPPSTGYTSVTGNYMDYENQGIEITLNIVPVKTQDFRWDMNYTFSKNKNEVTDIEGADEIVLNSAFGVSFVARKGDPLGVFTGPAPVVNDNGQYVVNPDNGYYESNPDGYLGTSQRDFVMGLQNNFKYKDFTLSFGFDWKEGGKMYSYTARLSHFVGNALITTYNDRNPFIIPNSVIDNGDGTYSENTTPVSFGNVTNFYNASTNSADQANHVIDKTFIRMRDISLRYDLSGALIQKIGLSGASFTIYGKNLFLWTPNENPYVDPEVSTFGTDLASEFGEFGANPTQRTYGASLKLTF